MPPPYTPRDLEWHDHAVAAAATAWLNEPRDTLGADRSPQRLGNALDAVMAAIRRPAPTTEPPSAAEPEA